MAVGHIMMVCSANVCRSPLAQLLMQAHLADSGVDDITVESSAVRITNRERICEAVRNRRDGERWQLMAERHRAREVAVEDLQRSQLILVASRDARARLARLDPWSRGRTFTMSETVWLSDGFVRRSGTTGSVLLTELARHLDQQRGLRGPVPPSRWAGRLRRPTDPLTVPDGHLIGGAAHRRCQVQVEQIIARLKRVLVPG